MKYTNIKKLLIKFMGGGLIDFPTRFLRWVKIDGDTESDDGGGDTPVSNVKPWLKGLCINENIPEGYAHLADCFYNAGFAKGVTVDNTIYIKLTDEEIANYNEESLIENWDHIKCLFNSEKIEEYIVQHGLTIPEVDNTVFIPYSQNQIRFLTDIQYYYETYIQFCRSIPVDNVYGFRLMKIKTTDNEIYYIMI